MRRGRHAFRLVTLEGDVMHSGGSMTGGSSASRMTSLLSREREIKEHEKLLVELEEKIADYGRRIERGEAIRQEIKQRRAQAFEAIRQAQIDVSVAQERVRTLTAQREEHRAQQDRCALLRTQIAQNLAVFVVLNLAVVGDVGEVLEALNDAPVGGVEDVRDLFGKLCSHRPILRCPRCGSSRPGNEARSA